MNLFLLQIFCLGLSLLACRGDEGEDKPLVIFFSLIPVIGYLVGVISLGTIFHRAKQSKGKCVLGHKLELKYDSENEKWKNGRRPLRISVGGYTKYQCTCCATELSYSWKAF